MAEKGKYGKIVLLLAALLVFVLFASGASAGVQYDVQIYHSGKGEATVTVQTDETPEQFRERVESVIGDYRILSSDDMYELEDISETDGGYIVRVSFRRIDKIRGMGTTDFADASEYFVETGESYAQLLRWQSGNLRVTVPMMIDGVMGTIRITSGNGYPVLAKNVQGEDVSLEGILADRETVDASKIISLGLLDLEGVISLRIKVPGKIRYYAGGNCTLVAEDTVEYIPVQTPVIKEVTDSEGFPVFVEESIPTAFGYILYDPFLSPLAMTVIVVGSALVVGGIVTILVYLHRRGKRVLEGQQREGSGL